MTTKSMNGFKPTWMLLNLFKCLLRTVEKNIWNFFIEFKSETLSQILIVASKKNNVLQKFIRKSYQKNKNIKNLKKKKK